MLGVIGDDRCRTIDGGDIRDSAITRSAGLGYVGRIRNRDLRLGVKVAVYRHGYRSLRAYVRACARVCGMCVRGMLFNGRIGTERDRRT